MLLSFQNGVPQHDGMVMNVIAGRVDERDRAIAGTTAKILQRLGMPGELRPIAAAELLPTFRIMSEPGAQLSGRRDLLDPLVEHRLCLAEAARPQAIYKNANAVRPFRWLISSLNSEVRSDDRALVDSGDLRKLPRVWADAEFALELHFRAKAFEIAVNNSNCELPPVAQVGDRAVAGLD